MEAVKIHNATLYHGDCFDLLEQFGGLDAIVTDPPYGIEDDGGGKWLENGR